MGRQKAVKSRIYTKEVILCFFCNGKNGLCDEKSCTKNYKLCEYYSGNGGKLLKSENEKTKEIIEKIKFCLNEGLCSSCSFGSSKPTLTCKVLLEEILKILDNLDDAN